MRSFLITRSMDILTGLRLAGIEGVVVKEEELLPTFREKVKDKDIGIIILTEEDLALIEDEVVSLKLNARTPLVVTIPGREGLKDKNFLLKYVKEALGIKIG
jgi:V/A-type H+-transporting ATPase subunit F